MIPGPALVSSETDQGALEQATGRVLWLRIEGPVPRVTAEYGYISKSAVADNVPGTVPKE